MRDYGSVHTCFWSNSDIQALSDQAKLLALYLLTGPHTCMLGCFRLPIGYICEDLKWSSETVSKRLGELFQIGFATHDSTHNWIFIHQFLTWNSIENPNQGKSIRRLFEQVPIKSIFFNKLTTVLLAHDKHLEEPFRNSLQTLSKPLRNQDQEQEQEQEQDVSSAQSKNDCLLETVAPTVIATVCETVLEIPQNKIQNFVITIPLNDNTEFSIMQQQVDEWQLLYPAVDVLQTLRNICGWNMANPKRRKTRSGILRHIVSWLAKEQNQGGGGGQTKIISRTQSVHENNIAIAERWLNQSDDTVIDNETVNNDLSKEKPL